MFSTETLYEWGVRAGRWVLPRAPLVSGKLRRGLARRRDLLRRIENWARSERRDGALVWFHASSVGEGLGVQPVIEALRDLRPDLQIFYTFFSPSAESLAEQLRVDYADYLPLDVVDDLVQVMEWVRPDVIAFGVQDVWPNVTRVARWRGVKMALVNGTVASDSSRTRWPARRFLSAAYSRLDAVGAISIEDAARLAKLGVPADRIEITGDARFDQVHRNAQEVDPKTAPVSLLAGYDGPTLVAGSTWPPCEARLVPALAELKRDRPDLRALVAPHEPTRKRLGGLESRLAAGGLEYVRLSRLEAGAEGCQVILIDRIGALAALYRLADAAYVGGGFGRAGLHSVLEPAAFGAPVLFGPRHAGTRAAGELIERGGARAVEDSAGLVGALGGWLEDEEARRAAGAAALHFVQDHLGAGRRNAEILQRLLSAS